MIDLTGQRFVRLIVVERARSRRGPYWRCACDCGNETIVRSDHLRVGDVRSCGCLRVETSRVSARVAHRTHGLSGSPEAQAAANAKDRCRNRDNSSFTNYGGRGIEYRLPESPSEAAVVLLTALGPRPKGFSLDRVNNDWHYEIGNLRWATWSQQRRNQRRMLAREP
jgi:hypothetical protein